MRIPTTLVVLLLLAASPVLLVALITTLILLNKYPALMWGLFALFLMAFLTALSLRAKGSRNMMVGRYRVPNNKVGIVRRHYGKSDPEFKSVTPIDRMGLQANTLLPNHVYWLTPGIYSVEFVDATVVPEGCIGVVTALDGRNRPRDRMVGVHVECDNFQDGQRFLISGGEQGSQIATLAGGQTYHINTYLFRIDIVERTVVPPGTVGLVSARVGRVPSHGSRFGKHVDCDNFQNGLSFLNGGGEQGRQLAVLPGGANYDINPRLFSVVTVHHIGRDEADGLTVENLKDIHVGVGYTGVVITLDGVELGHEDRRKVGPRVVGHQNFRLPWVFESNGGTRGVQEETIDGGSVFALNPWFVRVLKIPTRPLNLEWNDKTESQAASNYDANLPRLVVTIQGYRMHVDMVQRVRITESSAPRLVREFGDVENSATGGLVEDPKPVQRFVEKVLGTTVEAYFSQISAESTIREFLNRYSEIRTDLAAQVRNSLSEWGVEAVETMLGVFEAEDEELNKALQKVAAGQIDGDALEVELDNVKLRDQIDAVEVNKEQRRAVIEKQAELNLLIEKLGSNNASMIHMIREITNMPVPNYIGGSDVGHLIEALPMGTLNNLVSQLHQLRPNVEDENAQPSPELPQGSEMDGEPAAESGPRPGVSRSTGLRRPR